MKVQKSGSPTFDILGLTLPEMKLLIHVVGKSNEDDDKAVGLDSDDGLRFYDALNDAVNE